MSDHHGQPDEEREDRLNQAAERPFTPGSLVGSFCHRHEDDGSNVWQGAVVAEPAPGVFLVEWFDWIIGASTYQTLVPIGEMTGDWRFYDSPKWMANAYENDFAPRRRQREREATERAPERAA
jgi:hypothetical protein